MYTESRNIILHTQNLHNVNPHSPKRQSGNFGEMSKGLWAIDSGHSLKIIPGGSSLSF